MYFYGITDIGQKRVVNQDNFKIKEYKEDILLAIVCDGMGGAKGGGVASSIAISSFVDTIDSEIDIICNEYLAPDGDEKICALLCRALENANTAVFTASSATAELEGMGTTLVCALITPKAIYSVNVGDSRMYHIENGNVSQVTRDHSYVQYLVDMGKITAKKARKSSQRNIITRAVGTESSVKPDTYQLSHADGEGRYILLCSDGLSNLVEHRDIAMALKNTKDFSPEYIKKACEKMVSLANDRGGNDNITVVIVSL